MKMWRRGEATTMLVIRIDGGGRGAQTTKTSFSDPKGGEGVGGVTLGNSRGEEGPHTDPPRWEKEGGGRSGRVVVIAIIPPSQQQTLLEEHLPKSGVVAKRKRC